MAVIRVPPTLPPSLAPDSQYTVQMSLHHVESDSDIFMEEHLSPEDLTAGNNAQQKVAVFRRGTLPQFKEGGEVHMVAHFWKRGKLVETQDCERV